MNPFRYLTRLYFLPPFFRRRPRPSIEVPIEHPPGRRHRGTARIHVVWTGGPAHPFPVVFDEPERHHDRWR